MQHALQNVKLNVPADFVDICDHASYPDRSERFSSRITKLAAISSIFWASELSRQKRSQTKAPLFVTGASGYIGGRLVPRLLEAGYLVRCLARNQRKLEARPWARHPNVEIIEGDVDDPALADAMRGCDAAFYLVHSMMAAGSEYDSRDRVLARNFSSAAAAARCGRIIYLGGLGETGKGLSKHLRSRREVELALADGPVPVTVLRAAMIVGSGSASFEILRYLVERLPVMVTPRWVRTKCQPIAVRNVLTYLVAALETPETTGRTLDIGGPEVLSYEQILQTMASARGLPRRLILPVPVLTPRLSSLWIHLVTPLSRHIARPLAEGLRNPVICRNDEAAQLMPQRLLTMREAIEAALGIQADGRVETSWSDAGVIPGDPDWAGGTTFAHTEEVEIRAAPTAIFDSLRRIGGGNGWYAANFLWQIRGLIDRLVGGPGLRRGRRQPERIGYGDALDFWRVSGIEEDRWLRLTAEMKVPGEAVLEFEIERQRGPAGGSKLLQTARFEPKGLFGILYWYAVAPLHGFVFRRMLKEIRKEAERIASLPTPGPAQDASTQATGAQATSASTVKRERSVGRGEL